jgi:membrane protein
MARISDVPHVFRTVGAWGFIKRVYQQINEDLVFTWAAALAYSWIFAIFPFFIFMLTLAPYLPYNTKDTAVREINEMIDRSMAHDAAQTLKENIAKVTSQPQGGLLSVGLLITIWAAAGGMTMTMTALDIAYDIDKGRPWWKQRLVAIALTIVVAVLVLLVLVLMPLGTVVLNWLADQGTIFRPLLWLINVVRYALALVLLFAVVGLIYYYGPSIRTKFHAVTPGAVFAIAFWLILGFVFRYYVNKWGSYDKTYGTVAGVAILLLVFYIDAIVLLVGAEINSEVDFVTLGIASHPEEKPQEAAAHAAPSLDSEQEALARELQSKRRDDLTVSPIGIPRPSASSPGAAPVAAQKADAGGTNKWLLALATLGVAMLVNKLRERSRARHMHLSRPQRLKQMYPVTYAAIERAEGVNGANGEHAPEGKPAAVK